MKTLLALLALTVVARGQYNVDYTGDLTYYGLQSPPGAGHCSSQFSGSATQPWTNGVAAFMALNHEQYADSSLCGMCIAYRALGTGQGATRPPTVYSYAQISDECPECKNGDLDIGTSGDGRWQGEWHGVACNTGGSGFYYSTQGSNNYYLKLQVSNTALIVKGVQVKLGDSYAQLSRTIDNYWQLSSASPIAIPVSVKITSVFGEVVEDTWTPSSISGPPVQGKGQFTVSAGMEVVGGGKPPASHPNLPAPTPVAPKPSGAPARVESGNCSVPVAPYGQCGGMGASCQLLGGCQDAPLPGLCCSKGYHCSQINKWFYYCNRKPSAGVESASDLITITDYGQCGGSDVWGTELNVLATDAVWNGTQCGDGFQCVRFDQYTWQCRDVPVVIPNALNAPVSSSTDGSSAESGNAQVPITQAACYA